MSDFENARALLREFKGKSYLYGADVLSGIGKAVSAAGKRPVLVCDTFPGSDRLLQIIRDSISVSGANLVGEIRGAGPNCPREDLFRISEELKTINPDVIISFGGGSTIDAAKAAEVLRTLGGEIDDYFGVGLVSNALQEPEEADCR